MTTYLSVSDAIDEWLLYRRNEGRKDVTIDNYRWCANLLLAFLASEKGVDATVAVLDRHTFMAFGGWLRKRPVTTPLMQRRINQPISVSAQATVMRTIANFLNWCESQGELPIPNAFRNRGLIPKIPRKPRDTPQGEAVEKLLATASKGVDAYAKRGKAMLFLFLDTGLRVSEIHRLNVSDYDRIKGRISILASKGGHSRFVSPGGTTRNVLDDYLRRPRRALMGESRARLADHKLSVHGEAPDAFNPISKDRGAFFLDRRGQRMSISGIRQWFDNLCQRAGVGHFTPHTLRHYALTKRASLGMPLFDLQRMAGHSKITTTQIYIQDDPDALHDSMTAASPLDAMMREAGRTR